MHTKTIRRWRRRSAESASAVGWMEMELEHAMVMLMVARAVSGVYY
jgi:hypothetical protein